MQRKSNKTKLWLLASAYPSILGLIALTVTIAPFLINLNNFRHSDQFAKILRESIVSKTLSEVDIMSIPSIEPMYIGQLNSSDVPYLVSFPWWDKRINGTNYQRKRGRFTVVPVFVSKFYYYPLF